tara:strand:- start:696 stop:827 length:132 start_codon:yes stop_codon:yes gene_type:complete
VENKGIMDKNTVSEWSSYNKYYLEKPKGIPLGKITPQIKKSSL